MYRVTVIETFEYTTCSIMDMSFPEYHSFLMEAYEHGYPIYVVLQTHAELYNPESPFIFLIEELSYYSENYRGKSWNWDTMKEAE